MVKAVFAADDDLDAAIAGAAAAWPGVRVPIERFRTYVLERREGFAGAGKLCVADLYLACGCAHGDSQAIAELERVYLAKVGSFISLVSRDPTFVSELRQLLRHKLLMPPPKIADYTGRGSLAAWLRIAAVRTALNLRRDEAQPTVPLQGDHVYGGYDPELQLIAAQHRSEFQAALEATIAQLSAAERGILKFYCLDGLTIEQIAAVYGRPRSTVARRIDAARTRLLDETRSRLAERLHLGADELESLLRVLPSQIQLSLGRLRRDDQ